MKPHNSLLNRNRAATELLHRFIEHGFDGRMRMHVLLGRQMVENLIGSEIRELCGIKLVSLQWRHLAILSVQ